MVILAMAAVLFIPYAFDNADADDETIEKDGLIFQIIEDEALSLIDLSEDFDSKDLVIPMKLEFGGMDHYVVKVEAFVYQDCIETVTIPASVVAMDLGIFFGENISSINVMEGNFEFCSIDGVLFDADVHTLIQYPRAKTDECYSMPSSVSKIANSAFSYCKIKELYVSYNLLEIGYFAFKDCKELSEIDRINDLNTLPNSVTIIDDYAFEGCSKLTSMRLPDSLKILGTNAFASTGLKTVTIPAWIYMIGEGAFADCPDLVYIDNMSPIFRSIDGVLYEYHNDVLNLAAYPAGKKDESFTISKDVADIWPLAFSGCVNLKEVELPRTLMVVPNYAFYACYSLEKIDLSNIVIVEALAFKDCISLKNVTFGDQIKSICEYSFTGTALSELRIPGSVSEIDYGAFSKIPVLKTVTIDENCSVDIWEEVFWECINLTDIYIGSKTAKLHDGTLNIGTDADKVTVKVTIPKDLDLPDNVVTEENIEYTELVIQIIGERPFPLENIAGIIVCILILIGILRIFRSV